jgi:hypothetical protein
MQPEKFYILHAFYGGMRNLNVSEQVVRIRFLSRGSVTLIA